MSVCGGLLGGLVAAGLAVPRPALACHTRPDQDRYCDDNSVGFFLGLSFEPRVRLTYGIDIRWGRGPTVPFTRIEGHGLSMLKLSGGLQFLAIGVAEETGLAFRIRRGVDGFDVGAHLAAGLWQDHEAIMAQGTVPFLNARPYRPLAARPQDYDLGLGFYFFNDSGIGND